MQCLRCEPQALRCLTWYLPYRSAGSTVSSSVFCLCSDHWMVTNMGPVENMTVAYLQPQRAASDIRKLEMAMVECASPAPLGAHAVLSAGRSR